jgi:hypothetical protein
MVPDDSSFATVMHQPVSPAPQHSSTRLSQGIHRPRVYIDSTFCYSMLTTTGEPSHLIEALDDGNWKVTMDAEFDAVVRNKTWHLVPSQKGTNVISCKWVYKIKRKSNRSLDCYKAWLVVKGFK